MPNIFINETGIIGQIFESATVNITGSLFLTGLMFLVILFIIAVLFRMPLELTGIFLIPIILVFMSFNAGWIAIGGLLFIYLAVVVAKNFYIK